VSESRPLYAHTPPPGTDRWHLLSDHLRGTATLAYRFAEPFGGADVAYALGLVHDLGKAACAWQDRLVAVASTDEAVRIDHKVVGTQTAEALGLGPFALAVWGHHGGLVDAWRITRSDLSRHEVADEVWRKELDGWLRRWGCPTVVELRDDDRSLRLDPVSGLACRVGPIAVAYRVSSGGDRGRRHVVSSANAHAAGVAFIGPTTSSPARQILRVHRRAATDSSPHTPPARHRRLRRPPTPPGSAPTTTPTGRSPALRPDTTASPPEHGTTSFRHQARRSPVPAHPHPTRRPPATALPLPIPRRR
jgi:CRISPR-associated endonuclease Cas3-HD